MKALIDAEMFRAMGQDRERISRRRVRHAGTDAVVIRESAPEDNGRLNRLALLDSAPAPAGPMLVAEREGMLVAAGPLRGGRAVAGPVVPRADIVGLPGLRRAPLGPAA